MRGSGLCCDTRNMASSHLAWNNSKKTEHIKNSVIFYSKILQNQKGTSIQNFFSEENKTSLVTEIVPPSAVHSKAVHDEVNGPKLLFQQKTERDAR